MKVKAVLFDLDGTLLPMDQNVFIKAYLGELIKILAPQGYDPDAIGSALWKSTGAVVKSDGSKRNDEVFWDSFCAILGNSVREEEPLLEKFYQTDFQKIKNVCGYSSTAKEIVTELKDAGITTVLATNPLFPAIATESRMRWAGLEPNDFAIYTTYENSRFCKPNLQYYQSILSSLDLQGEECVMVGNDVEEDMIAEKLGMRVFLLTDNLINKSGEDISKYRNGGFPELKVYIKEIINEQH